MKAVTNQSNRHSDFACLIRTRLSSIQERSWILRATVRKTWQAIRMSRLVRATVSAMIGAAGMAPSYAQDAAHRSDAPIETVTILGTARSDTTELTSTAPV